MLKSKGPNLVLVNGEKFAAKEKSLEIKLDKDTEDILKQLAHSCKISKTKMIRKIIEDFIHDPDHMTAVINECDINGRGLRL